MARLNQIIAIEKGLKTKHRNGITEMYHTIQKPALLSGLTRTYSPKDEEGEKLPAESIKVQVSARNFLEQFAELTTELFDITATKEWANCLARSDVEVDGVVLAHDVPVTYLLFLEKTLEDMLTFVRKIPLLDPAQEWKFDKAVDCYVSAPVETTRSKKTPKNHIKAPATDKHPAQVEVYQVDEIVGYWKKIEFSGALPAAVANQILSRIEKLQRAVKFAREAANTAVVEEKKVAKELFDYILSPLNNS